MAFNTVDTSTKTSTGQSYGNQYDLQKTAVRDEEAKRRKLEQEALQRQLASRGFGAGSGFAEASQNKLQQSNLAGERARLMGIDVNQLSAAEAANEAQKNREFTTSEREGSQAYGTQERLGTQGFQTQERLGQEKYGTQERLGTQGFQTQERLGTQAYGTQERLGAEAYGNKQFEQEMGLKRQALDDAANQFNSKLDFDYWAQNAGYTEAERDRAWKDQQNVKNQNFSLVQDEIRNANTQDLAILNTQLSQSTLNYQNIIANNNAALKSRTDLMFTMGANGTPLDEGTISKLTPLEQDAYNMGIQGKYKSDYDAFIKNETDLRNQQVLSLATDPKLADRIKEIWGEYDYLFPTETYTMH